MKRAEQTYERLVAPLEERLTALLWRCTRNTADAEEALQETLAKVWRKLDRIEAHPNPEALVLRIAANAAHDIVRKQARSRLREERASLSPQAAEAPDRRAQRNEAARAISEAVALLPDNQRLAVTMRLIEGQTYEVAAAAIGCRPATVRKHVERGRARLRTLLAPLAADLWECRP
jgi:RNA polymerase sigma-70 factor (ECF subfamily)